MGQIYLISEGLTREASHHYCIKKVLPLNQPNGSAAGLLFWMAQQCEKKRNRT
jgi:hypothetical protein